MTYSQSLADRIRDIVGGRRDIQEKKMFGGVGFLLGGNLLVGVWKSSLIARVGPEQYPAALKQLHVREFDITGRSMQGWVMVEAEGIDSDDQLREWVDRATAFVADLPAKPVSKPRSARSARKSPSGSRRS